MTRAELIEALETAQGADRGLDAEIYAAKEMCVSYIVDAHPSNNRAGWVVRYFERGTHGTCVSPAYTGSIDAALSLATGDNAKFVALSKATIALDRAGWPNGTWHEHLPRFIAAACLRAGGE